jgi:hypothetical protein
MSPTLLGQSDRFQCFALVFAIVFPVCYVVCDMARLPLFTYHPGTGLFDWGWVRPRRDEGPAMYWYGWLATSGLASAALGGLVSALPQRLSGKIPMALAWIVPLLLVPVLLYSLKYYWRW